MQRVQAVIGLKNYRRLREKLMYKYNNDMEIVELKMKKVVDQLTDIFKRMKEDGTIDKARQWREHRKKGVFDMHNYDPVHELLTIMRKSKPSLTKKLGQGNYLKLMKRDPLTNAKIRNALIDKPQLFAANLHRDPKKP